MVQGSSQGYWWLRICFPKHLDIYTKLYQNITFYCFPSKGVGCQMYCKFCQLLWAGLGHKIMLASQGQASDLHITFGKTAHLQIGHRPCGTAFHLESRRSCSEWWRMHFHFHFDFLREPALPSSSGSERSHRLKPKAQVWDEFLPVVPLLTRCFHKAGIFIW